MSQTVMLNGVPTTVSDDSPHARPTPVPPVILVPQIISDRQFFQQLAIEAKITQDEALAAVATGTLPAQMATLVAELPSDQQFPAKMLLMGATQFDRGNALAQTLSALYGMSPDDLDAFWRAAALL